MVQVSFSATIKRTNSLKEYISIWLNGNIKYPRLMHCVICGNPFLRHNKSVATMVPGDASSIMRFPIEIECKNNNKDFGRCPAVYVVEGFTIDVTSLQGHDII